jgi:hypothetical protein
VQTPPQPHLLSNGSATGTGRDNGYSVGSGRAFVCWKNFVSRRKEKNSPSCHKTAQLCRFTNAAEHRLCRGIEPGSAKRRLRARQSS